jgi:hypothetical protein
MLSAHWLDIGPLTSLAVVVTVLSMTILLSLVFKKTSAETEAATGGNR